LQAIGELYLQGDYFVSLLVGMFILVCPLLYLLFLLTVIAGTVLSFSPATKARLVKVIIYVLPWSMAEVFLAGVLVALIKVIALADVTLEVSFWAYVVFAPLFTYIVTLADAHRLWMWVKLESTSK
jgi:paraquat-inducible protein A